MESVAGKYVGCGPLAAQSIPHHPLPPAPCLWLGSALLPPGPPVLPMIPVWDFSSQIPQTSLNSLLPPIHLKVKPLLGDRPVGGEGVGHQRVF